MIDRQSTTLVKEAVRRDTIQECIAALKQEVWRATGNDEGEEEA